MTDHRIGERGIGRRALGLRALGLIVAFSAVALQIPYTYTWAAPGPLTITPLGWDVVGLDSNNVNVGPNVYPVGARVCNTGTSAVTNLSVAWSWGSANAYVGLTGVTSFNQDALDAGGCDDFYFDVRVTRDAAAYDTSRRFTISASGDSVGTVTTPSPREIYVEHLVSQNRNAVLSWTLSDSPGCDAGTGVVLVGSTCTATIVSKTATGGYEQLVNSYYFDNSMFRIDSLSSTYSVPVGYVNTQMYADACGWENDPSDPDYLSCLDTDPIPGGKAGGNPITTTVTFTVVGEGSQDLTGVIYDYSGSSFHYNSDVGSGVNLLALTAQAPPSPPTAADDSASTDEDTSVDIDVLANDSDPEGNLDPSSLAVHSQPANGTATVVGGQIRYTPDPDFSGTDTFTYEVCDTTLPTPLCSTATVSVTVSEVNDPPTAADDSASTDEDTSVDIDVLANDSDVDDGLDVSSVTVTGAASNGTTSVNPDGTIDYTPDPGWSGTDTFTYQVCDLSGECASATVSVTVSEVNDPPTAADDSASTDEDTSVDIDVLANDSDVDGDALTASGFTQGTHGSVSDNGDGTVDYTPDPGWSGTDTFTYTVCDPSAACDSATVTVVVDPVNLPPSAVDDAAAGPWGASIRIDVLANDSDPDGSLDETTLTVTNAPAHGSAMVNPDGTVDYTPNHGFVGTDSFDYRVCDDGAPVECVEATVTVAVSENEGPEAQDDTTSVDEDSSVTIDVLDNDSDPEGGDLSVTGAGPAGHGTVEVNPDGTILYTPDLDFEGADTFTYTACDEVDNCSTAQVAVTVSAVNDAPTATDDVGTVKAGRTILMNVLANDSDPDGTLDPSTVVIVKGPSHGSVIVNPDGTVRFTADEGFDGLDRFVYRVCDDLGSCRTATAWLTIWMADTNLRPEAADDSSSTSEDISVEIDVLTNDSDPEGGDLTIESFSQPLHGSVVQKGGQLVFTPNPDWSGTTWFTYVICDRDGACDEATVDVVVEPVSDAPHAGDDAVIADGPGPITVDVLENDDDVEGEDLTVDIVVLPAHGTANVAADGSIIYEPDPGYNGPDTLTYEICQPDGKCSRASVTIRVLGNSGVLGSPGTLASTGGPLAGPAFRSLVLLLLGMVLVRAARRRSV
jgi:hypothetical protein